MLKVSFLPHLHHHCELSVVSVTSNGDIGFPLVMDTAVMTFVMKVEDFLVLMGAAVVGVGVDSGGVGVGGVGGVDGVDGD